MYGTVNSHTSVHLFTSVCLHFELINPALKWYDRRHKKKKNHRKVTFQRRMTTAPSNT